MNMPIQLYYEGEFVANILTFNYETPWCSGKVEFQDNDFIFKLINISSLRAFDLYLDELELNEQEENDIWENKLKELNLTWEDLSITDDDKWFIIPKNGNPEKIYSPIFVNHLNLDLVYIRWR